MKNKFLVVQVTGVVLVPIDARERNVERSPEATADFETFIKDETESNILHAINTATSAMKGTFHGEIEVTAKITPTVTISPINASLKKLHWKQRAKLERESED